MLKNVLINLKLTTAATTKTEVTRALSTLHKKGLFNYFFFYFFTCICCETPSGNVVLESIVSCQIIK